MAKTDDTAVGIDPDAQKRKREDSEDRLGSARAAGRVRSFDRDDENLGWDAQQGVLPEKGPLNDDDDEARASVHGRRRPASLYADDPVVYRDDQLPDPEVLREDGYQPVINEHQTVGGEAREGTADDTDDATLHDGGPQTANIQDPEVREPVEVDEDGPRNTAEANAEDGEDDGNKSSDDTKDDGGKKRAKKSTSSSSKKS